VIPGQAKASNSAGETDQRILTLWNAITGELEVKVPALLITSLEASPDGKWVAEGGADKRVRIRSGKTLAVEKEFRAQDGPVSAVAWHPKLPILATASGGSVRLWSTKDWRMLEEFQVGSPRDDLFLDIPGEEGRQLFVTKGDIVSVFEPQSFQKTP
ncbi:MAG: WD40 repeat domain-containing protein, partial [Spartobacteria bacterium]